MKNAETTIANQKKLGPLYAFKSSSSDRFLAFHTDSLEVAEIDETAWNAFEKDKTSNNEALDELINWAKSVPTAQNGDEFSGNPTVLQINIAQICNLHCDYCAAGGDGTYGSKTAKVDLTAAYAQVSHMLKQLKSEKVFRIHFIGGEPLLFPNEIHRIAEYTKMAAAGKDLQLKFSFTTNGTLITAKTAALLASLNAAVTISLDGPPEINNLVRPAKRKDKSSSQMTEDGLNELLKVRSQLSKIAFNSVFGRHNIDLVATYKYLSQWNPDTFLFNFASEKIDTDASEIFVKELGKVLQLAYEKGGRNELLKIRPFADMLYQLECEKKKVNFCGAGKTMLHMDTKGDLRACNWFIERGDESLGTAGKPDSEKISQYSQSLIDLHDCGSCWAKFLCGGGCMLYNYEKNGDKHMSDKQFCYRTRKTAQLAIEYFYKLNSSS